MLFEILECRVVEIDQIATDDEMKQVMVRAA